MGRAEEIRPRQVATPTTEFRRHSRGAIGVLAALPVFVFALPALFGHPVVPSDDLTQNYPLRVLVGTQLRNGQLPLFDPYIWSGAPLLGGWNAGAAYPLTWLFAVMSGSAAWTLNLMVTYWVAGLGTFAFLRASRLSTAASFVGGLSFAFAGAMAAQVPHFGFVAGMSWTPVALVALLKLSEHRSRRTGLAWSAVLAGAIAMVILAGEPRAIDDAVVVIGLYALWRTWRLGRGSGLYGFLGLALAGVTLGVVVGAVQWLPGIDAVHTSQRAVHSTALFDAGSLAPKWLVLSIVPDLFGGAGSFGQPTFFAPYSLSEITGYVGLLPLVAAFALLGRLHWRRRLPEWVIWHVIAVVGVVLALGGNTFLGPVLEHLPLFGDQRLQSRNIMIADLALAVLLAYWVDVWLRAVRVAPRRFPSARQLLGLVPALGMVAVVTVTWAWGAGMLRWLGLSAGMANNAGSSAPWLVPFLVLGLAASAMIVWGPKLERKWRARLLVGFVAVDIGIFTVLTLVMVAPGLTRTQAPTTASSAASHRSRATPALVPLSTLVHGGRFAIYDPDQLDSGQLLALGVSDINVLTETPSVEGYSSIVDNTYAQVTGSHQASGQGQNVLDPAAVSDGTLDQLDTTVLLTPSASLVTPAGTTASATGSGSGSGRRQLAAEHTTAWSFGSRLDATALTIPVSGPTADESGARVGLVDGSGSTQWAVPTVVPGVGLEVSVAPTRPIVAVRVTAGDRSLDLGAPEIETAAGASYRADGPLQDALVAPRWTFHGFDGAFAVFDNSMAQPVLSLRALPSGSTAGASVRATAGPQSAPTTARVSSPAGVVVVRASADIPGWTASWRPSGSSMQPGRWRYVGPVSSRLWMFRPVGAPSHGATSHPEPGWA